MAGIESESKKHRATDSSPEKTAAEMTSEFSCELANGETMPYIGLGTWLTKPDEVGDNVITAARLGYRHFDCAERYCNQREIGKALKQLWSEGFDRKDFFITSKLWCTRHDKVEESLKQTLKNLQLEYLDLYLIHFPEAFPAGAREEDIVSGKYALADVPIKDTWSAMEAMVKKGLVKSIGVSNFAISELRALLSYATIRPAVNQVEVHPYNANVKLVNFCKENQIQVIAYSVLGNQRFLDEVDPKNPRRADLRLSPLLKNPLVKVIAQKHNQTHAQVLLRWCLQRGLVMLHKSLKKERLDENRKIFDFALKECDMIDLLGLTRTYRLVTPAWRKWPGETD